MDQSRRRSDGERTYSVIIEMAMAVASIEGLGGLTIGRLAEKLGMSKSGVYAHFKSKERLQLDTIEAARQVFFREVIEPGMSQPEGLAQLRGLCDAFLSYVERRVFPGGCFFAGLLGEFDAQPGTVHEQVAADHTSWLEALVATSRAGQQRGELDPGADVEQLVFELDASMELGNYLYLLFHEPEMLQRARTAVRESIDRRLA